MFCLLSHVVAERLAAHIIGPVAAKLSAEVSSMGIATPAQMPSGMSTSTVFQHWHLSWGGLKTYEACGGAFGDVLTISTRDPGTNAYIAQSVSEHLAEFYPAFGSRMLEWIARIYRVALQDQTTTPTLADLGIQSIHFLVTPGTYSENTTEFSISSQNSPKCNGLVTLTGTLRAGLLTITCSANTTTSSAEVKRVLAWILLVLQPREKNMQGLFSLSVDESILDNGLPEISESIPNNSESSSWRDLFSYAVVVDLPHLPHIMSMTETPVEGLEIDLELLSQLAAVDRETQIEGGGVLRYGFDTAIVPLEPPESRKWHYFATEGQQITPMRAEGILRLHGLGTKFKLANRYQEGKVYVG